MPAFTRIRRSLQYLFNEKATHSSIDQIDFQTGLGDSGELIAGLVRSLKPQVCVEIGSARGFSACHIGLALKKNGSGKLFAIDPHRSTNWNDSASIETLPVMQRNLEAVGVTDFVHIMRQTSEEAAASWKQTIDLLFIDGDHSYAGVKRDWKLFQPFVRQFGVILFHDTLWDLQPDARWVRADMGVPRFVEELRAEGYPVITIDRNFGVSIVQATKQGVPLTSR